MKWVEFSLICLGVLLNAAAQLCLKAGMRQIGHFDFTLVNVIPIGWSLATNIPIISGLSCYVFSLVIWIMVLSRVEVSTAYPMLSLGYILNAVLAWWLFGEGMTAHKLIGISMIIMGVIWITQG